MYSFVLHNNEFTCNDCLNYGVYFLLLQPMAP